MKRIVMGLLLLGLGTACVPRADLPPTAPGNPPDAAKGAEGKVDPQGKTTGSPLSAPGRGTPMRDDEMGTKLPNAPEKVTRPPEPGKSL